VQGFESTDALIEGVSAFLGRGLLHGDSALVVMELAQWNSVAAKLTGRGVLLTDAIATGQLTVLDAHRILERIMLHGSPSRGLFEEAITRPVRHICASGTRLRVYSDLINLLMTEENFRGALELEKMWNDLAREESLTMLWAHSPATLHNPEAGTLKSIWDPNPDMRSKQLPSALPVAGGFGRRS
jgi:MEDS: MEthanogen/methylotroph, DcmR Sensory domain